MTDTVVEDISSTSSHLSPGDCLDYPLNGEDVTTPPVITLDEQDLSYLGTSVFDVDAMSPLSPKSIVGS